MKDAIKNILLWLLVITVLITACFLLNPAVKNLLSPTGPAAAPTAVPDQSKLSERISQLQEEKQNIEAQLETLRLSYDQIEEPAMSVMILFSTPDESVLQEAAPFMARHSMTGLLGISASSLQSWRQSGVPAHFRSLLDAGWELCYVLTDEPEAPLQSMLENLDLPKCTACYRLSGSSPIPSGFLEQHDISIVLTDGLENCSEADGIMHVPAVGNMNNAGFTLYESKFNTGESLVYVVGNMQMDQEYVFSNFAGMIEEFSEDCADGTVQNVPLQHAYNHYLHYRDGILQSLVEYQKHAKELEDRWSSIMQQIGNLRQKLVSPDLQ